MNLRKIQAHRLPEGQGHDNFAGLCRRRRLVYVKIASQAPQVPFWIGAEALLLLCQAIAANNKVRE
jgi:hypothetical protein